MIPFVNCSNSAIWPNFRTSQSELYTGIRNFIHSQLFAFATSLHCFCENFKNIRSEIIHPNELLLILLLLSCMQMGTLQHWWVAAVRSSVHRVHSVGGCCALIMARVSSRWKRTRNSIEHKNTLILIRLKFIKLHNDFKRRRYWAAMEQTLSHHHFVIGYCYYIRNEHVRARISWKSE